MEWVYDKLQKRKDMECLIGKDLLHCILSLIAHEMNYAFR